MATFEYWIQLENRPWDASPHNIDRMSGMDMKEVTGRDPVDVQLISPGTGVTTTRTMYNPLRDSDGNVRDALILRRYRPPTQANQSDAWTVPDDRKVNPWDLNELDPTDSGTMGTIPGPVIECNVGDSVKVHFRNLDRRTRVVVKDFCFNVGFGKICIPMPTTESIEIEKRVHSLHPHGFVFKREKDGAYPLSPPDPDQPIAGSPGPDESTLWATVPGFSGKSKKGDRVPPEGTFIYEWNTIGWPSTSNVWLYHDHSICDMENVELGAIGIIVIHNVLDTLNEVDVRLKQDPTKLDPALLPDGSPNGSPVGVTCFPLGIDLRILPHELESLGSVEPGIAHGMPHDRSEAHAPADPGQPASRPPATTQPVLERVIRRGDTLFELDEKLSKIFKICLPTYDNPPTKALYLQLFHTFAGSVSGMMINGRTFLGNTPTLLAGRDTLMRFGVVGMGSDVHTFHIHGHRWVVPGPDGITPTAIQTSPQIQAVSQFEDTRLFGAANSFVFTIDGKVGSFMRAGGPTPDDSIGEWHMHCHVLSHMMVGMMGSLLIVRGGDLALPLPRGVPCEMLHMEPPPDGGSSMTATVTGTSGLDWRDEASGTPETTIKMGGTVTWQQEPVGDPHTVVSVGMPTIPSSPINSLLTPQSRTFPAVGDYMYKCGVHGGDPITHTGMWGIVHVVM